MKRAEPSKRSDKPSERSDKPRPYHEWASGFAKELAVRANRARRAKPKGLLTAAALDPQVLALLERAHPHRVSKQILEDRHEHIVAILMEADCRVRAVSDSGLRRLCREFQTRTGRARDAKAQAEAHINRVTHRVRQTHPQDLEAVGGPQGTDSPLKVPYSRWLRAVGIHDMANKMRQAAVSRLKEEEAAGTLTAIRRLWKVGVPAATIAALLKAANLPGGFTSTAIKNIIARSR